MNGRRIVVDEEEPETDVEHPIFDSETVEVRRGGHWVCDVFQIQEFLGRGKFGEVKRCSDRVSGAEFAAKFIRTPRPQDKRDVEHEVEIMKRLRHRRIAQLHDAFEARSEMCIVLEIISGGELFERVSSDEFHLSERACACIVRQICEGIEYMHSKNMIHLDLKPENIMCLSREGNRVKIIDFGLTREFDANRDTRVLLGTPEFMAPEVVLFDPIHFATDIWSVGVLCYVLLSGLSPFMGNSDTATLSNVTTGKYDFNYPEFRNVSQDAKDFIDKLLILDKRKRASAAMCLEHPWLKKRVSRSANLDLSKTQMKAFVCRRKWQKAFNVIVALRRMRPTISTVQRSSFVESDSAGAVTDNSRQQRIETNQPMIKATPFNCNGQSLKPTTNSSTHRQVSQASPQTTQQAFKAKTKIQVSPSQNYSVNDSQQKMLILRTEAAAAAAAAAEAKDSASSADSDGEQKLLFKQSGRNGLSNFHKLRSFFAHKTVH